jgi:hypothetical protein
VQEQPKLSSSQKGLVERLLALESTIEDRAAVFARDASTEAAAAAGAVATAEEHAAVCRAAQAAASSKPYKAWQPQVEEYNTCPAAPRPGELLPYFQTEEGLRALKTDPYLTRKVPINQKPLAPVDSAAATAFSTPGVYRAQMLPLELMPGNRTSGGAAGMCAAERGTHACGEAAVTQEKTDPQGMCLKTDSNALLDSTAISAKLAGDGGRQESQDSCSETSHHAHHPALVLPSIYRQPQAATELNDAFLSREYSAMRLPNTASAALIRARGRDGAEFALGCKQLDFGVVPLGKVVTRRIPLQNVSLARARFSVEQVDLPLRLTYPRIPVPAGLKVMITAELAAAGDQQLGAWSSLIVVRSALNIIRCPVSATFV